MQSQANLEHGYRKPIILEPSKERSWFAGRRQKQLSMILSFYQPKIPNMTLNDPKYIGSCLSSIDLRSTLHNPNKSKDIQSSSVHHPKISHKIFKVHQSQVHQYSLYIHIHIYIYIYIHIIYLPRYPKISQDIPSWSVHHPKISQDIPSIMNEIEALKLQLLVAERARVACGWTLRSRGETGHDIWADGSTGKFTNNRDFRIYFGIIGS